MTSKKRPRGRPRGTGIDDSERLISMALQIAAHPGIRPTTAIKSMGIVEQSTIRRLRDKYRRACQNGTFEHLSAGRNRKAPRMEPPTTGPHLQPANDDTKAETSSTARLQHYALALQSSVVAVQHRITSRPESTSDKALHELLDQQFNLSSILLGLITESRRVPPSLPH